MLIGIEAVSRMFRLVAATIAPASMDTLGPLVALLFAIGCNGDPELHPVSGVVLIDGEPLPMGAIRFVPKSGRPASSPILVDGSFKLTSQRVGNLAPERGLQPGKYRIGVSACEVIDEKADVVRWLAPRRYSNHRTSGLE